MSQDNRSRKTPFKTAEWIISLASQVWSFIHAHPLVSGAIAALSGIGVAAMNWLQGLPTWQIIVGATMIFILAPIAVSLVLAVKHQIRFDPTKHREVGADLKRRAKEMIEFIHETRDLLDSDGAYKTSIPTIEEFERKRRMDTLLTDKFYKKYSVDVLDMSSILDGYGIKVPFHVQAHSGNKPIAFVSYIALVGSMLEQDRLQEAKSIDNRTGFDMMGAFIR